MSTTSTLPDYVEITDALAILPGNFNAAQIHGLMCGLMCALKTQNNLAWQAALGPAKGLTIPTVLQDLYESTYHQITDFSFEFSLLLPADTQSITERAEALGLWCQGFFTGLEQARFNMQKCKGDVAETLEDLLEISQVSDDDIPESEEDETAYFELVEYVRLAVLMLFHEWQRQ